MELSWISAGKNQLGFQVSYVTHEDYVFKKKEKNGKTLYEIWRNEELKENQLDYFEFKRKYRDIKEKRNDFRYNGNFIN